MFYSKNDIGPGSPVAMKATRWKNIRDTFAMRLDVIENTCKRHEVP
jgi:hypothetical protein